MRQAVFIDRDGVINRAVVVDGKPYPPPTLGHLEILPGVSKALQILKQAGYQTIIVTNQPDVATGIQRREVVEDMHSYLRRTLPIDDIYACYHIDEDDCRCRKPHPGMLEEAAECWQVDLSSSFMVGDRWRDIEAGIRAGCRTILVQGDEPYRERAPQKPNWVVRSLLEASTVISSLTGGVKE